MVFLARKVFEMASCNLYVARPILLSALCIWDSLMYSMDTVFPFYKEAVTARLERCKLVSEMTQFDRGSAS